MSETYHHEQFIFVFGSNQAGRHGKGAADAARRFYGAQNGVGEGRRGMSYAIPTKDADLTTRPLEAVSDAVMRFLAHARSNPETPFLVTRVGCGLAGFSDPDMASLFSEAPANVWLPRKWTAWLNGEDDFRLIVAGSRDWQDQATLFSALDHWLADRMAADQSICIISGDAPGADRLGEAYAKHRGLTCERWAAAWHQFGNPAGPLRNQVMAWRGDALALFRTGNSPGSRNMLDTAEAESLAIRTRTLNSESA